MTRRKDSVILNLSKRIVTYHIRKNATLKRRKQSKLLIFNGIFDDSLRIKRPHDDDIQNGFTNLCWYTDDGYSGANFQRPGFQAMLADIEAGKVGTVIVKDYCAIISCKVSSTKSC